MIKFYNSLTRKKEEFTPKGEIVKMYSCGPTVYGYAHIGNYRAYIFMDNIRRVIKANGYKINGVMNVTDVGHLTSDEDEGEDKMLVASEKEHKTPWEIAEFYTNYFMSCLDKLNVDIPEHIIKATSVIDKIIAFVKDLVDNGMAYETENGIYYDVSKDEQYGILSGLNLEQRMAGARVEVDEKKHHPADFALWIKAPREHIMQWDSPWGRGYPGWHIECSVIGTSELGDEIDIHTGGMDHIPVHHENEIAQNYGKYHKEVVHTWMHLAFLQVDGGKMGKSLNNFYTLEDLEARGFSALDYKYFSMTAHYRKPQNFTFDALGNARTTLNKIYKYIDKHASGNAVVSEEKINEYKAKILEEVSDDLNYPNAISILWDMLKNNEFSPAIATAVIELDKIFGLDFANYAKYIVEKSAEIPENVKVLAQERWEAKKQKNWAVADEKRKEVEALGYVIKDKVDGFEILEIN